MNSVIKTTLVLAVIAIIVTIVAFMAKSDGEMPTKFQLDLESFNVERSVAKNIDLYFQGKREYLTWDELQELVNVYNLISQEFEGLTLTDIENSQDLIIKLNSLIEEMASIRESD